jgi:hypothetical protein
MLKIMAYLCSALSIFQTICPQFGWWVNLQMMNCEDYEGSGVVEILSWSVTGRE